MTVHNVAAQACPVCDGPITLQLDPNRWVHTAGQCTSAGYQRLCDPDPFARNGGTPQARARIRARTRRSLYASRVRGTANTVAQRMSDDHSAPARPEP